MTTHHRGESAADGEAESGSSVRLGVPGLGLHEGLEDGFQSIGRDANTGILDHELGAHRLAVLRDGPAVEFYLTTCRSELDGVTQQVDQDLFHAFGIANVSGGGLDTDVELHAFGSHLWVDHGECNLHGI